MPRPLVGSPGLSCSPQAVLTEKVEKVDHIEACVEADGEKENHLIEKSTCTKTNPWTVVGKKYVFPKHVLYINNITDVCGHVCVG